MVLRLTEASINIWLKITVHFEIVLKYKSYAISDVEILIKLWFSQFRQQFTSRFFRLFPFAKSTNTNCKNRNVEIKKLLVQYCWYWTLACLEQWFLTILVWWTPKIIKWSLRTPIDHLWTTKTLKGDNLCYITSLLCPPWTP